MSVLRVVLVGFIGGLCVGFFVFFCLFVGLCYRTVRGIWMVDIENVSMPIYLV